MGALKALYRWLERRALLHRYLSGVRSRYYGYLGRGRSTVDYVIAFALAASMVRPLRARKEGPSARYLAAAVSHFVLGLTGRRRREVAARDVGFSGNAVPAEALRSYWDAMSILGKIAMRDLADDYDRAGVIERGKFALLLEPSLKVDHGQARQLLLDAIARLPHFAEAHFALGLIARALSDPESAAAHFLIAAAMPPVFPRFRDDCEFGARANHEAGALLADLGRVLPAEYCFRRAIEIDPRIIRAHRAYARMLSRQGDQRSAARQMALSLSASLTTDVPAPIPRLETEPVL
jgi:tetratricopeptide (TPR) repeat protein